VPFRTCGKLIVGNNNMAQLESLRKKALANGVQDVQLISADQVAAMEPEILALPGQNDALWSPSTGIVDSHAFLLSLLAAAEETGSTTLALHSNVKDARILSDGRVGLRVGSGGDDDVHSSNSDMWLSCGKVFNCAGLWADEIARKLHTNTTKWQPPRQYYCKGNYFRLQGVKPPFSHLIYPLPDVRGGLGVHATIDLAGQVKFGPDVEWLDTNIRPDEIDWNVDERRADAFYQAIRQYWPALPDDALAVDYAGARPKLAHPDHGTMSFADFVIAEPEAHGVKGLVHLFGIESPGLTSALALAEYVTAESLGRD
jgi:L-2-hydroxyglutarate oxidase LhgO